MKQLDKIYSCIFIYFSLSSSVIASKSTDIVEGYDNLTTGSKILVESYLNKVGKCFISMSDGEDYPIHNWLISSHRTTRVEILKYHGLYNHYVCSDKERQQMIKKLRLGSENDLLVLSSLNKQKILAKPSYPPWFTDEQQEKVQQLIKKYPKPSDYGKVFFRIEDSKNR